MNKILGMKRSYAIFASAFLGCFGLMLVIPRPEPIVLLCCVIVFIVWAIVIQWWIVAGLLVGILLPGSNVSELFISMTFGVFGGLMVETAIWARRKPTSFWRNFFFPQ
jgi:hypothetical protein